MHHEKVTYQADGLNMISDVYYDDSHSRKRPGILVYPDMFGLNDFTRNKAKTFAELGFTAIAVDIHGDAYLMATIDEVLSKAPALTGDHLAIRRRAQGAMDALCKFAQTDTSRMGAIGFCFGGRMALELARSGANLAALAAYHAGLSTPNPADAKNIKGRILACTGFLDGWVKPEHKAAFEAEMSAAGVDWQHHIYGTAKHTFTNPEAHKMGRPDVIAYDPMCDKRSWSATMELFEEVFPGVMKAA